MLGHQYLCRTSQHPFSLNLPNLFVLWTPGLLQKAGCRVHLPEIIHPPFLQLDRKGNLFFTNPKTFCPCLKSSPVTWEFRLWKIMSVIFLCFCLLSCSIPACTRSKELPSSMNGKVVEIQEKRKHQEGKNRLASQNVISPHSPHVWVPFLCQYVFNYLLWLAHFCYCFFCLLLFNPSAMFVIK